MFSKGRIKIQIIIIIKKPTVSMTQMFLNERIIFFFFCKAKSDFIIKSWKHEWINRKWLPYQKKVHSKGDNTIYFLPNLKRFLEDKKKNSHTQWRQCCHFWYLKKTDSCKIRDLHLSWSDSSIVSFQLHYLRTDESVFDCCE